MSVGKNLQFLRKMKNLTQEELAEKLAVSRQTVSKWELDDAQPEIDKAISLCELFNCSLDDLFRSEMNGVEDIYTNLRTETVKGFRYVKHAVVSVTPEDDAIDRILTIARSNGVENPKVIGWDFPVLSQEQISVYNMHGYEAAWILPEGMTPSGCEIHQQEDHLYAAITITNPFENPFASIPKGYQTLLEYIRVNGLERDDKGVIPCFEVDGESMDIYIAVR